MQAKSANTSHRSITFLTDNENEVTPLVNTLLQEKFTVNLHSRSTAVAKNRINNDMDLFLIESSSFSLQELSAYSHIRSQYKGLLVVLIDDLDEMLQVLLYEQGVDDLFFKPINPLLLLARIRALFRRNDQRLVPTTLTFNGLEINKGIRRVSYQGEEIELTSREFDLLWYMAKNACTTLDRDHLYRDVFGIEYNGFDRSIDMYIARCRAKLAPFSPLQQLIKTVRGKGYLFAPEQ